MGYAPVCAGSRGQISTDAVTVAFEDQGVLTTAAVSSGSDHEAAPAGRPALACVPWRTMEGEVAAWDRLAARASEPNPFFESWYLLPSLRHLAASETVEILRFSIDGDLAGLLPVQRARRYYGRPVPNLAEWLHENCFCGTPLVARGAEHAFWRAVLDWAGANAGLSLFLHLRAMIEGGTLHRALEDVARQQGRQLATVHHEQRALLASPLTARAYLEASLSTGKRKELRRQARRLAELGEVQHERLLGSENLDAWCGEFLALEGSGWKGKAGSALACDARTAQLFRNALAGAGERSRLERLALRLDGQPIAMLASFLGAPGAFSFKTAFDEAYARFSPGVLLQLENLAVLDNPAIAWSDSCAASDHPMIDHLWRERRGVVRLSLAIGGRLRRSLFSRFVAAEIARHPVESPQ